MTSTLEEELINAACSVLKNAYCPYSKFPVGAALLAASGTVYKGVNVENASYPVGICAERSAISNAVSSGEKKFLTIVVTTEMDDLCFPCGMCRQFISEFGTDIKVILFSPKSGKRSDYRISELLPHTFTKDDLLL